jgi:hypothetical protein
MRGILLRVKLVKWRRGHVGASRQARPNYRNKTKHISLSLVSSGEEHSNTSKHRNCVLFREVAALTDALKELAADGELETGSMLTETQTIRRI